MLFVEELILEFLKVINFLLTLNVKIGRKLTFLQAKYSAEEEIDNMAKKNKFDLRGITDRAKKFLIYDQDILDRRWNECLGCEHLIKATNQCKKCGCFMKVKHHLATASCPVGKWGKEYNFIQGKAVNGTTATI